MRELTKQEATREFVDLLILVNSTYLLMSAFPIRDAPAGYVFAASKEQSRESIRVFNELISRILWIGVRWPKKVRPLMQKLVEATRQYVEFEQQFLDATDISSVQHLNHRESVQRMTDALHPVREFFGVPYTDETFNKPTFL